MKALKKYYFQLGYSCNNNCWHCFLPKSEHPIDLTTKQIKNTLLEAKEEDVTIIALTGGEPTIRDDIFDIIKYCKKLKFEQIELQTNGRLCFYKKFAKKIVEAGVTDVYVSFHSNKPDVQNYITRSSESFSQSSKGIKNLVNLDVRLQTNTVISKLNYKHLKELIIFLKEVGVKKIELDFPRPLGNAWKYFSKVIPTKTEIFTFLREALDTAEALGFETIFVDDYPICFMKGYERYNADFIASRSFSLHDENSFNICIESNLKPVKLHEKEKIKGPKCSKCKYDLICKGDWKEYIKKIGWGEFLPVI